MKHARWWPAVVIVAACTHGGARNEVELGKQLFLDQELSNPPGQSCADCHAPAAAFRDPESDHTTSMGVITGRFGSRNSPGLLYARYIPPLHVDPAAHRWVGGLFWDGRASSFEDQAAGPLLNPLEMNNPDKASLVARVKSGPLADALRAVYGSDVLDDPERGFTAITRAIAAYERSDELAPFTSKYDRYLAGHDELSEQERRGLAIFEDPARGNCAGCHPSRPGPDGSPPLFTDFSYANVGVPRYDNNLFYKQGSSFNPAGAGYIDHGLMTTVHDPSYDGAFRVPTLRNVARTQPFGHNGYFANLSFAVDFLTSRTTGSSDAPTCSRATGAGEAVCAWPAPELASTVDPRVGHYPLSADERADVVAFLGTLTDDIPAKP